MKTNKLFVYGTLREYGPFRKFLNRGSIVAFGRGKIKARRVKFKYPAIVEDGESYVEGEIFEIKDPEEILPVFDKYEEFDPKNPAASLYVRKIKKAVLGNKKCVRVFVYVLNKRLVDSKAR